MVNGVEPGGCIWGSASGVINVYLQIRQLSESLFTFWVGTFVRPIACVDSEKGKNNSTVNALRTSESERSNASP